MEIHGNLNLVDSEVKSDEFASTKQFNRLIVNDLSEIDQELLDHETVIFNKSNKQIYTYQKEHDRWMSVYEPVNDFLYNNDNRVYINVSSTDMYNQIMLDSTQLRIDSSLFDFGPIGSPIDFVIDFWLTSHIKSGTILYNGLNTGQVDLEQNKNLLITTSGSELVKDPNYQSDPTIVTHSENDGYINIARPNLQSSTNVDKKYLIHVALIRSGLTTYLAIDGKIEDSAPSVEYFHYDDVLIGGGYIGNVSAGVINLRVTKGTDLGWITDFTPPNYNPTPDVNTDFLMDSTSNVLVDNAGNYDIVIDSGLISTINDNFFIQLTSDIIYPYVIDCDNQSGKFRFPTNVSEYTRYVISNSSDLEVSSIFNSINKSSEQSVNKWIHKESNYFHEFVFFNNSWHEIPNKTSKNGVVIPNFDLNLYNDTGSSYNIKTTSSGNLHHKNSNSNLSIPSDAIEYTNIFGHNFPYLNCNKLPGDVSIGPETGFVYFHWHAIIRVDDSASANIATGTYFDLRLYNTSLRSDFETSSNHSINSFYTFHLEIGNWYHVAVNSQYRGYSGSYEKSRIRYYIKDLTIGQTYSNYVDLSHKYGYYRGQGFHTLHKCPVSIIFLGWGTNHRIYIDSYLGLFT